jgi:hypothetical protein
MSWGATAAITAIVSAVASTTVAVVSNNEAADASEEAALARNQALQAEARNKEVETNEAIKRQRIRDRREMARLRASLANQGTETTSGTPLLILGEAAANMELGIQDAVRRSNMEAASLRAEGRMGMWEAGQISAATQIENAGAIASGIGKAAGAYSDAAYNGQLPGGSSLYPRVKSSA